MLDDSLAMMWRNMIREEFRGYRPPAGVDVESHFRTYVEGVLEETLPDRAAGKPGANTGVYLMAIVLLTYGRRDMVPLILDALPPKDTNLYALAGVLRSLLPLPSAICHDYPAIRRWFDDNESALHWDEAAGRFLLGAAAIE